MKDNRNNVVCMVNDKYRSDTQKIKERKKRKNK